MTCLMTNVPKSFVAFAARKVTASSWALRRLAVELHRVRRPLTADRATRVKLAEGGMLTL